MDQIYQKHAEVIGKETCLNRIAYVKTTYYNIKSLNYKGDFLLYN